MSALPITSELCRIADFLDMKAALAPFQKDSRFLAGRHNVAEFRATVLLAVLGEGWRTAGHVVCNNQLAIDPTTLTLTAAPAPDAAPDPEPAPAVRLFAHDLAGEYLRLNGRPRPIALFPNTPVVPRPD